MKISIDKLFSSISLFSVLIFNSSCSGGVSTPSDTNHLIEFHETYFAPKIDMLQQDDLSLYVDYSTCITMGQHSRFFQSLQPSLVNATKHYFSIRGAEIKEESGIDIYSELRNIVEVNYADLERAANLIAAGNSEAVLLTDGEYYQKNIAGGGINDPYMADALKVWLKKGHDIYIIAEPYIEKHKGKEYSKQRFYFLFTDNRLQGNIYDRIIQTVNFDQFTDVQIFHLSADHPTIMAEGKTSKVNQTISATQEERGDYEIQDWPIDWKSIEAIVLSGVNPETGEALPYGECVIGGLKVDKSSYGGFEISDIDVKVYDIGEAYSTFYYEKEAPSGAENVSLALSHCPNTIIYDEEAFKKDGKVNLYFDAPMWTPDNFLTGSPFNYTKVDICVSKTENVFNQYASMFVFDAIGLPGESNVSVAESVKQCLFDPEIQKMMNSAILYSIYIKSNKY